jgi:methanethiol S-methyltransferase
MVKRLAFFAYGCFAYVVFLGTFLYAMGFVSGFVVPTRLDGPAYAPLIESLLIDTGLLTLFAVQHSVMARRWFKAWWTQFIPDPIERSTYVLLASLALLLLFAQWRPLGGVIWSVDNVPAKTVLWTMAASGWGIVLFATILIDHFDLFGVRQVWLVLIDQPRPKMPFATPALYRVVRHPLYFGFILAFWATPTMTLAHFVFAVVTTAYIVVAIQFEESDLIAEHGIAYETYKHRVPMLIPRAPRIFSHPTGDTTRSFARKG